MVKIEENFLDKEENKQLVCDAIDKKTGYDKKRKELLKFIVTKSLNNEVSFLGKDVISKWKVNRAHLHYSLRIFQEDNLVSKVDDMSLPRKIIKLRLNPTSFHSLVNIVQFM